MGSLPTHSKYQLLRNRSQTVSQYVFIRDFIILKSEIVSIQFHFKPTSFMVVDPLEMALPEEKESVTASEETKISSGLISASRQVRSRPVRGEITIVFVLKDGTTRVVTKNGQVEEFIEMKLDVTEQMKVEAQPRTSKTSTTTTIKKVPVNPW